MAKAKKSSPTKCPIDKIRDLLDTAKKAAEAREAAQQAKKKKEEALLEESKRVFNTLGVLFDQLFGPSDGETETRRLSRLGAPDALIQAVARIVYKVPYLPHVRVVLHFNVDSGWPSKVTAGDALVATADITAGITVYSPEHRQAHFGIAQADQALNAILTRISAFLKERVEKF